VIAALTTVLFAWAAVRENAGKKGLTKKQWHLLNHTGDSQKTLLGFQVI
jgi:hypothetical protein